jgi:hypothetical protein
MTTRRETLKALAVAATLQHQHAAPPAIAASYKPVFFTASEYARIVAIVERIIPGAKEADVARYVDEEVAANPKLQPMYRESLAQIKAVGLGDAMLRKLDDEKDKFWLSLRRLTIDGFYSSKTGLQELGYSGKSFLTEFKGCTHPEHQS